MASYRSVCAHAASTFCVHGRSVSAGRDAGMRAGLVRWKAVLRLLLAVGSATAASELIETTDELVADTPRVCYSCALEHFGADCAGLLNANSSTDPSTIPTEKCIGKASRCQVWRFYSDKTHKNKDGEDKEDKLYFFERGCSDSCTPGCVSLEDMENRFVSCYSCCNEDKCNIDNAAVRCSVLSASFGLIAVLRLLW